MPILTVSSTGGVSRGTPGAAVVEPLDIRALHERLGRVNHQPVRVRSFTNKRFTVNFRVPLDQLRQLVPPALALDEVRDTGLGMLSLCACDFWVSRLGWLPLPPVRNNDMLCRISTRIRKGNTVYRAYYTLRSDSSSRFLGFFGKRFSHFRKQVSPFVRVDDGRHYRLECQAADPLGRGKFQAVLASLTKAKPDTTLFADIAEARQFVFDLDGSCGYDFRRHRLSFQKIDYPPWDLFFCHEYTYEFPLLEYVCATFGLQAELDCVLFMQNTRQTWGSSWLYRPEDGELPGGGGAASRPAMEGRGQRDPVRS